MDNNINFRGTFLVKKPTPKLKEAIFPALGRRKIVFNNFAEKGDMLYVIKNYYDKGVADVLIKSKNAVFKYYPTLNTKSGFDTYEPDKAKKILRNAARTVVTTKQKLMSIFRPQINHHKEITRLQDKNLSSVASIAGINLDNEFLIKNIDTDTGACTLNVTATKDIFGNVKKQKHTLIRISAPGKYGICYARIVPISIEEPIRRIAIKNGKKIFEYSAVGSNTFIKNSREADNFYQEKMQKLKLETK